MYRFSPVPHLLSPLEIGKRGQQRRFVIWIKWLPLPPQGSRKGLAVETERSSGCSAVRLAYLLWEQRVASSNLATPTRQKRAMRRSISLHRSLALSWWCLLPTHAGGGVEYLAVAVGLLLGTVESGVGRLLLRRQGRLIIVHIADHVALANRGTLIGDHLAYASADEGSHRLAIPAGGADLAEAAPAAVGGANLWCGGALLEIDLPEDLTTRGGGDGRPGSTLQRPNLLRVVPRRAARSARFCSRSSRNRSLATPER